MKKVVSILFAISIFGCHQQPEYKETALDSLKISIKAKEMTDSIMKKARSNVETSSYNKSISTCPILITKAYIKKEDYSKSIVVNVRNNSGKKVDAIKVSWTLYNNFDEEVDTFHQNGISQDILLPGKFDSYSWNLYSTTATKAKAYIFMIHFSDGSKWELQPDL